MDSMTLVREAGITYRQLDYWERTGLLGTPREVGNGYVRQWTAAEAAKARTMGSLVRAGLGPRIAAKVAGELRDSGAAYLGDSLWIVAGEPPAGGERP